MPASLIPLPGEVTVRTVSGRLIPVQPAACPVHADMAHFGVEPVCEAPGEGRCCTEFGGRTDRGTVQCAALHAPRTPQPPMVALVALQKRENLPPPHNLN